jgi:hypothetical protein
MSHKRKDTLVPTTCWAQHLRPAGKRQQAKAERREAIRQIVKEAGDGVKKGARARGKSESGQRAS